MKKVLLDLSVLKHINCGLGQVAYNYGVYFSHHTFDDLEITLLLPKKTNLLIVLLVQIVLYGGNYAFGKW